MMQNKKFIALAILAVIFLTGCSVNLSSSPKKEKPITHGFWRSIDGGDKWEYLTSDTKTGWFPPINIYSFVSDPHIHGIIYALSDYGLWRTINQGDTWIQVNKNMRHKGEQAILHSLIFNMNNTNQMFVSGLFTGLGKVYGTNNGGDTWQELYKELKAGIIEVGVAVDANNPKSLYALSSDLGFRESFDEGKSWRKVRWLTDEISDLKDAVALQFWANPSNINEMFILTDKGIYRSLNKGSTWEPKNNGLYARLNPWDLQDRIIKINKMIFDTKHNLIYAASKQGIFESVDRGENWRNITQFLPVRIPSIEAISYSLTDPNVIYFTTDSETVYRTFNKGKSWDSAQVYFESTAKGVVTKISPASNLASAILIDGNNPQIIYLGITQIINK